MTPPSPALPLHMTYGDKLPDGFFKGATARIMELQQQDGSIRWFDGGVVDPWNHTEAAMGLAVVGEREAARRAFRWLAETQLVDGSWWGELGSAVPIDNDTQNYTGGEEHADAPIRDTNFSAYIASGVWHYYRLTHDDVFLKTLWPHVEGAMTFVLSHQTAYGDIRWAAADPQTPQDDALVAGCSSIYKSLACACWIAHTLKQPYEHWWKAREQLGECLRQRPERFDRTWASKAKFSMDWYYPVLSGVLRDQEAHQRLEGRWNTFVVPDYGCRCVIKEPWVTVAEAAELAIALLVVGQRKEAESMLAWQHQWRDETGAYWMGYQYEDKVFWPVEKPAWTAAAVILATDAIVGLSPAGDFFIGDGPPIAS
ncbi:MAG: hypothetical protein V6Z81_01850 [Parvularculales bacterium]